MRRVKVRPVIGLDRHQICDISGSSSSPHSQRRIRGDIWRPTAEKSKPKAHLGGRLETQRFVQRTAFLARMQIDPLETLFAAPPNDCFGQLASDTTPATCWFDVDAMDPRPSRRRILPSRNPLHNLDGGTATWLGNPRMPSSLRNRGTKIRFQCGDHAIHGEMIGDPFPRPWRGGNSAAWANQRV